MTNKIMSFLEGVGAWARELLPVVEDSGINPHQTEVGMAGAIDAPLDPRNIMHSELAGSSQYYWRNAITRQPTKIKDQGQRPSCGGQAGAEVMEYFTGVEQSADFIYNPIAYPGGGTTPQDLANFLCKNGSVAEAMFPSLQTDTPPIPVPSDIKANGAKTMQFMAVWADDLSHDTLAMMNDKYGNVIFTIKGENNGTWLSPFPAPSKIGTWCHFMKMFDAYMDVKKYIVAQQSWGIRVGRNGVQLLEEGHMITSAFSLVPKTQGQPVKYEFTKDINYNDVSRDVFMLQRVLWGEGFFPMDPTLVAGYDPATGAGTFGNMTALAVRQFLRAKKVTTEVNIQKNGGKFVGPLTRTTLNAL